MSSNILWVQIEWNNKSNSNNHGEDNNNDDKGDNIMLIEEFLLHILGKFVILDLY